MSAPHHSLQQQAGSNHRRQSSHSTPAAGGEQQTQQGKQKQGAQQQQQPAVLALNGSAVSSLLQGLVVQPPKVETRNVLDMTDLEVEQVFSDLNVSGAAAAAGCSVC